MLKKRFKIFEFLKGSLGKKQKKSPTDSKAEDSKRVYSEKEEQKIKERLRELGYLD